MCRIDAHACKQQWRWSVAGQLQHGSTHLGPLGVEQLGAVLQAQHLAQNKSIASHLVPNKRCQVHWLTFDYPPTGTPLLQSQQAKQTHLLQVPGSALLPKRLHYGGRHPLAALCTQAARPLNAAHMPVRPDGWQPVYSARARCSEDKLHAADCCWTATTFSTGV